MEALDPVRGRTVVGYLEHLEPPLDAAAQEPPRRTEVTGKREGASTADGSGARKRLPERASAVLQEGQRHGVLTWPVRQMWASGASGGGSGSAMGGGGRRRGGRWWPGGVLGGCGRAGRSVVAGGVGSLQTSGALGSCGGSRGAVDQGSRGGLRWWGVGGSEVGGWFLFYCLCGPVRVFFEVQKCYQNKGRCY